MDKSSELNDVLNYPQLTTLSKRIGYAITKVHTCMARIMLSPPFVWDFKLMNLLHLELRCLFNPTA